VVALARTHGVEMPISTAMHAILFENVPIAKALGSLRTRRHRPE
jgi:glycerol-3-phosphate dehydrogenase